MARKSHLAAMEHWQLEAYRDRLYLELAAVNAEREVRKSLDEPEEETIPLFDLAHLNAPTSATSPAA